MTGADGFFLFRSRRVVKRRPRSEGEKAHPQRGASLLLSVAPSGNYFSKGFRTPDDAKNPMFMRVRGTFRVLSKKGVSGRPDEDSKGLRKLVRSVLQGFRTIPDERSGRSAGSGCVYLRKTDGSDGIGERQ